MAKNEKSNVTNGANPQQAAQKEETKPLFGNISQETKVRNAIPFLPPIIQPNGTYQYPKGYLIKVAYEEIKTKDDEITTGLCFYFIDETREREHTERMFIFDPDDLTTDKQGKTKLDRFNYNVAHIYSTYDKLPEKAIGSSATTIEDYFKAIADAFNTNGKDGTPIFKSGEKYIKVWLKLVYYKSYMQFPYLPNFIERVKYNGEVERPCTLTTNPAYDAITMTSSKKKKAGDAFDASSTPMPGDVAENTSFPNID